MELTHIQKRTICDIAQEAYNAWDGRAEFERTHSDALNAFNAWRHQEQLRAVGLQSLTLCTQEQYRELVKHFAQIRSNALATANNLTLF